MARKLIVMLLLVFMASEAKAGDLFTRTWAVVTPGYNYVSNCRTYYQPDVYGWVYSGYTAPAAQTYVAPKAPAYTPDWKVAFPKYLEKRDDHAAYLAALSAVGAQGQVSNFQSLGYSQYGGGLNTLGSFNAGNYGVQGNSIYGYSTTTSYANQLPAAPTAVDLMGLYLQASQHVNGARSVFSEGNAGFQALVQQQAQLQGTMVARERELAAKTAAVERVMRMLVADPSTTTTTVYKGSGATLNTIPPPNPMPNADGQLRTGQDRATAFLLRTGMPLCGKCHSGKDAQGKFDITTFPSMTDDQKEVVFKRLTSRDPKIVMPRKAGTDTGYQLSPALLQEFVTLEPAGNTP